MQPKKGDRLDQALGYALSFLAGMGFFATMICLGFYNWGGG